jgi:hypothetical protein
VEFLSGSLPPIYDELKIDRWISFGSFGHISYVGYKPAPVPIDQVMILLIGQINAFIGIVSSSESVGSPSDADLTPEELDDSSNTLVVGNNSDDDVVSILPVLDYESDGGSIRLISGGSTALATIFMAATTNNVTDLWDPITHTPDPNAHAPPDGGGLPLDILTAPITTTTSEDLEAICVSLCVEQDCQCTERDRLHIDTTTSNAISQYRNQRIASQRLEQQKWYT